MLRRLHALLTLVCLVALVGETTDVLCAEPGCGLVHVCPDGPAAHGHTDGCDDLPDDAEATACLCHAVFLRAEAFAPDQRLRGRTRPAVPPHVEPSPPAWRTDTVPVPPPLG